MRTVASLALFSALTGCVRTVTNTRTDFETRTNTIVDTDVVVQTREAGCEYDADGNATVCLVDGTILEDEVWRAETVYVLIGGVFVGDDVNETVLTIEPGTKIVGDTATRGFLVIRRNSRIEAVGTPDQPIVFTSAQPAGSRSRADWGGLIINGNAPINTCDVAPADDVPAVDCEAFGEGASGYYGGADPNDNSGTLEYVRVEFGGYPVTPSDELNGVAFQGVGSGTTVNHLQVHMGGDDAVEFFGGTVDVRHLVLTGTLDDMFDWTFGWTGRAQFVVGQQYDDVGNMGIEADNNETNNDFLPRAYPTLSNFTLIGTDSATITGANTGVLLRRGTAGELHSFVLAGWDNSASSFCLEVKDTSTLTQVTNGDLTMVSSIVDCAANFKDANSTDFFTGEASNLEGDPGLANPFDLDAPDFAPEAGSLAASGGTTPSDPFFTPAAYRGAVDPNDNWVQDGIDAGWISTAKN